MNQREFKKLDTTTKNIHVADLTDISSRTLLWGFDFDRNSIHVYIEHGILCFVKYNYNDIILSKITGTSLPIEKIIPPKRCYPDACDYEFCKLLKMSGYDIVFTTFDKNRPYKRFHGKVIYKLKSPTPPFRNSDVWPAM